MIPLETLRVNEFFFFPKNLFKGENFHHWFIDFFSMKPRLQQNFLSKFIRMKKENSSLWIRNTGIGVKSL